MANSQNAILRNNWKFRRDMDKARTLVWKRDKGKCAVCGMSEGIYDVHHKTPISKGGALFDLGNLQTLCRKCHKELHRSK